MRENNGQVYNSGLFHLERILLVMQKSCVARLFQHRIYLPWIRMTVLA